MGGGRTPPLPIQGPPAVGVSANNSEVGAIIVKRNMGTFADTFKVAFKDAFKDASEDRFVWRVPSCLRLARCRADGKVPI
jgi:hypothetical protein